MSEVHKTSGAVVVATDDLLEAVIAFLLDRARDVHARLVKAFEKVRRDTPRLGFGRFAALLEDTFGAADVCGTPLARELYENIGDRGEAADVRAAMDARGASDVVVDPARAATALWRAGIFPTAAQAHRGPAL